MPLLLWLFIWSNYFPNETSLFFKVPLGLVLIIKSGQRIQKWDYFFKCVELWLQNWTISKQISKTTPPFLCRRPNGTSIVSYSILPASEREEVLDSYPIGTFSLNVTVAGWFLTQAQAYKRFELTFERDPSCSWMLFFGLVVIDSGDIEISAGSRRVPVSLISPFRLSRCAPWS